jgi:hypothetical protein
VYVWDVLLERASDGALRVTFGSLDDGGHDE